MKKLYSFQFTALIFLLVCSTQCLSETGIEENTHMGVATCASSVCHGKRVEDKSGVVNLNEFTLWSTEDSHSRAFKTLLSKESSLMAKKLGLKNAHTAKLCLDCHADNIAVDKRGPKFQLSDGVGCEACHGGAERWLKPHTEKNTAHINNVELGMYPLEKGLERAKLCMSCHYGTKNKLASHKIMGAGHPRLSFELETFTVNQPAHYQVDDDYLKRKGNFTGFSIWLIGQVEALKSNADLLRHYTLNQEGVFPELFFYDCHACHHDMSALKWQPSRIADSLPPGQIRLQEYQYSLFLDVLNILAPELESEARKRFSAVLVSATKANKELPENLNQLLQLFPQFEKSLIRSSYSKHTINSLRTRIAQQASKGAYPDYMTAEQAFLAVESMSFAIDDSSRIEAELNALYDSLENEERFKVNEFVSIAKRVYEKLKSAQF